MLRGLGRMLGAEPVAFALILRNSLVMDFRISRARKGGRGNPFFGILVSYFILGFLMALVLGADAPSLTFAAVTLTLVMMNTLLAVLMDFHTAILSPEDAEVVSVRPVTARTYFLARYCNFLFYVSMVGAALSLGPASVLVWAGRAGEAAALFGAGLAAGFFCAGVIVVVYALMIRWSDLERLRDLFVYVQTGMTLLLIGMFHVIGRTDQFGLDRPDETGWVAAPPVWFGSIVTVLTGQGAGAQLWMAGAAAVLTVAALLTPVPLMSFRYSGYLGSLRSRRGTGRLPSTRPRSWLSRLFFPGIQGTVLRFCVWNILRDRPFKMRALPMTILPVVFLVWATLRGDLSNPFLPGRIEEMSAFPFLIPLFILLASVQFIFAMQISDHHEGAWVFRASPAGRGREIVIAWQKTVLYGVAVPLLLLFGAATAVAWGDAAAAVLNLAIFYLQIDVATSLTLLALVRHPPFSRPLVRGEGVRHMIVYLVMMFLFIASNVVQMAVYQVPTAIPVLAGTLLVLAVLLRSVAASVVGRRILRPETPVA